MSRTKVESRSGEFLDDLHFLQKTETEKAQPIEGPEFLTFLQGMIELFDSGIQRWEAVERLRAVTGMEDLNKSEIFSEELYESALRLCSISGSEPPPFLEEMRGKSFYQFLNDELGLQFAPDLECLQNTLNQLLALEAALLHLPKPLSPSERAAFRAGIHFAKCLEGEIDLAARYGLTFRDPDKNARKQRTKITARRRSFKEEAQMAYLAWREDDPEAPWDGSGGFLEWLEQEANTTELTVVKLKDGARKVGFREEKPKSLRQLRRWRDEGNWQSLSSSEQN